MNDRAKCPRCGEGVPAGSPGGMCPRCLLAAGFESGGAGPGAGTSSAEEIAKEFPAFEMLEVLGQGGMGVVYKARQKSLDRLVAIKVLPPEAAREPGFADRFQREARTLARLHHAHIVGVHEFGETNGLYYLVMEYVDGPNLRQVIRDGLLTPAQALAIVPQVCDALQYAHDQGVVHRDVKPENVLLDRQGRAKIADFGLAKLVQRTPVDLTLTRAGQVMGTLQYMAPEQHKAPDSVDHRADIYSLGVVFYEMLTGELPVGAFPPPSQRVGVDPRLDAVVTRALERDRDRRWQKASEMGTRVGTIASSPDVSEPAPAPDAASEAVPAPRVSRLAVASALSSPAAVLAGLVVGLAARTAAGNESGAPAVAGLTVTGVLLLFGLVAGVAALARIQTSGGRMIGRLWAVIGIVLALATSLALFVSLVLVQPNEPAATQPPERLTPPPRSREAVATAAAKVLGGTDQTSDGARAEIVDEIEGLWMQAVALIEQEPNPDARALHLAPSERRRYAAMTSAERKRARQWNRLGLLFQSSFREVPFRLAWVVLDSQGRRGRVVRTGPSTSISFPVSHEEGRWWPALGVVEIVGGTNTEQYNAGWIDDTFADPLGDPAARVTGGPSTWTDADRHAIARDLHGLWRTDGKRVHGSSLELTERSAAKFRFFHAALDASGDDGRIVVGADDWSVSVPVFRVGERWGFKDSTGAEGIHLRNVAAGEEDRDGWLGEETGPSAEIARKEEPADGPEAAAAAKVAGGPAGMTSADKAKLVGAVEAMWSKIVSLLDKEPNPDVRALALAPSERRHLAMTNAAERQRAHRWDRLGVLFQEPWGEPASGFNLTWVVLDADGKTARVVRASAQSAMAYPIVFEDGRWFPGLGLFELSGPVHEEGYRTGWLRKDFAGPRGDPADRVSGGPEHWSDVDRHELAGTFRELWRVSGPQAAVRVLDGGKIDAQQAHGFDLYHAALDATGKRGRLVVGDEKWTVIVPLVHDGSAWQIGSGSGQTRKRAPREEDRDGSLEIPASPELTEARKEAAAAKVVGGAPNASTTARALLAEEVEGLWKRIVATAETEPNPDVRAMTLAPSHRTRWTAMSNAERKALREASRAGIVFQDPQDKWLAGFGLVWVVIDTGTDRARVVRANSSMKLSFPIVREEGRWHPALGYVEVVDGTTDEEDRSGWIGPPLVGPRMDPAARVTGGPATLTDADRHAIVRALDTRWRGGQDVAADALKAGGMGPTEGAQFRLYHVALDADGKNGRLVLGDAGRALVLPIALEGGGWSVLGKGGETRNSPPGPDDRDGYLHR